MCGIFSIISSNKTINISKDLIAGLKLLEYRGYDSAGIAILTKEQRIIANDHDDIALNSLKVIGEISNLESAYEALPLTGYAGIAHTRWATHGAVTIKNAHPIIVEDIAVVHNGVVENYFELRQELHEKYGYISSTETDTEVISALIYYYFLQTQNLFTAVRETCKRLIGKLSFIAMSNHNVDEIICASIGRPMIIGASEERHCIASDIVAFSSDVNTTTYLESGDIAIVSGEVFAVYDFEGNVQTRNSEKHSYSEYKTSYESYKTFMYKEICEQKVILQGIAEKIQHDIESNENTSEVLHALKKLSDFENIHIIACGAAYYAGYVGKYLIERECGIHVSIDIASEFCIRSPVMHSNTLYIFISQSGETADTISAMELVQKHNMKTLAIVNRMQSPLAKKCDLAIPICAGVEQSVAATKTFTAQILILMLFSKYLQSEQKLYEFVRNIDVSTLEITQSLESMVINAVHEISDANRILYVGKDVLYPICLEGALKIKEIGYIAAEGIAGGEIKHGPLALVDEHTPVVILAPHSKTELFTKIVSSVQEIHARNGKIILITCKEGREFFSHLSIQNVIEVPSVTNEFLPILYAIPLQLIAYHYSLNMGYNIDKPRNLAKSVTVE